MKNEPTRNDRRRQFDVDIDTSRARRSPSRSDDFAEIDLSAAYRRRDARQAADAMEHRQQASRTRRSPSQSSSGRSSSSRQSAARSGSSRSGQPPRRSPKKRAPKRRRVKRILMTILVLLILTPVVVLGGGYLYISGALSGEGAGMGVLGEHLNTPKEYKGDVVNFLVCGIDYEEGRTHALTDMIMYVNFDVKNKKINMLQIPRDTYVGGEYSSNGKINAVASHNGGTDISLLADRINAMFALPIDYYVTIDMDSFKSIVDTFGGIEVYIPQDMEWQGSRLGQGYRNLNGDAAERFVRNRHGEGFETGDFARLEMQRYFYSGLFNRLRTMTPGDIAKLFPVFLTYMKTDMPVTDMASVGISALGVPSQNIMMCRVPEYGGAELYLGQHSVNVVAAEETAELLNTYFRTYGEPVSADQLQLPDYPAAGGLHDAAVSFMGEVDAEGGITSGNFEAATEGGSASSGQ